MEFFKKLCFIFLSFYIYANLAFAENIENSNLIPFDKVKSSIESNNNEKLSLKDILKFTLENNDELNAEKEKTKATETLKFKTITANTLPNVGADLSYGKIDFEQDIGSTKLNSNGNLMNNKLYVQQPIFKSGRTINQLGITNNQIEIQHNKLSQKTQEVLFNTIMATVNLLQSQEIYKLTVKNEESLKNNYEYILAKRKVGRSTISELSLAEARYNSAKTNTIEATTSLLNAKATFLRITKIDSSNINVNFDEIFKKSFDYNENFRDIVDIALNKNPEYAMAKNNYQMNKYNLKLSKTDFLPELYLNADVSKTQKTELITEEDASVSLNLRIPIFQSGTEYVKNREASHLLNQSKFDLNNTKDLLINEVITTYDEFLSSKSSILSSKSYRDASKFALENTIIEEKVGRASIVNILDRRKEYFDTEISLLNYKTNVVKYYYALKMLMGELNVVDIFN